jgi:hypothetical protein
VELVWDVADPSEDSAEVLELLVEPSDVEDASSPAVSNWHPLRSSQPTSVIGLGNGSSILASI